MIAGDDAGGGCDNHDDDFGGYKSRCMVANYPP